MQNLRPPVEAADRPLPGPYRVHGEDDPQPFFPLRLRLQGCDLVVTLSKPDMLFGRHTDADVRLPLPDVSRRHCRFVSANGVWQVFDLDSLNGVHVNGARVKHAALCHGDQIRLGGFTFAVELGATASLAPAADADTAAKPPEILQSISDALPLPTIDSRPKRQAS